MPQALSKSRAPPPKNSNYGFSSSSRRLGVYVEKQLEIQSTSSLQCIVRSLDLIISRELATFHRVQL